MPSPEDHMLRDLRRQAETMSGPTALPKSADGEPIFDEPWQGRAVALAIETVAALGASWELFRSRLIAAIDDDPRRSYYESWVVALEDLIASERLASAAQVDAARMAAASYRTTEQNPDDLEVFPLPVDGSALLQILTEIFTGPWKSIRFGLLIQGAAYELAVVTEPRLSVYDGYVTIDLGPSHLHLCIDDHRGLPGRPVPRPLARRRRCAHAELQRQWFDGAPRTWMFRMFNGDGDQMLTVLLPNPFLDDDQRALAEPDWSRLDLWDQLRRRHLDLPPDPDDRRGTRFVHP